MPDDVRSSADRRGSRGQLLTLAQLRRHSGTLAHARPRRQLAVAHEPARRLLFPRVGQKFVQEIAVSTSECDADGRQTFAPSHLLARIRRALDRRPYSPFVQHHVHPLLAPQRREDLSTNTERRTPVMILLDGFGQRQGERPSVIRRDSHGRNVWDPASGHIPQRWPRRQSLHPKSLHPANSGRRAGLTPSLPRLVAGSTRGAV